jgi:hypothetical protein
MENTAFSTSVRRIDEAIAALAQLDNETEREQRRAGLHDTLATVLRRGRFIQSHELTRKSF